jgi:hypothetical protein
MGIAYAALSLLNFQIGNRSQPRYISLTKRLQPKPQCGPILTLGVNVQRDRMLWLSEGPRDRLGDVFEIYSHSRFEKLLERNAITLHQDSLMGNRQTDAAIHD